MNLTEEQLKQIIKEEFNNLINEEEIDEKLFSALKNFGKDLFKKAKRTFSGMPDPGKSGGVGSWYTRYKDPQKEPEEEQPEAQPSTALTVRGSTAVGAVKPAQQDVERGQASAKVEPRTALSAPNKEPKEPTTIAGELPPASKLPLQLPAPELIGIADNYSFLQKRTDDASYSNLLARIKTKFFDNLILTQVPEQTKNKYSNDIDSVLKYLILTNRVLSNSTIVPKNVSKVKEATERQQIPSAQQVGLEPWYIQGLINSTKKHFSSTIDSKLIEFVITTLYQDGRIAISTRMYNKLIHAEDPRIAQQSIEDVEKSIEESKSYSSFYNNWKKYTGVKI